MIELPSEPGKINFLVAVFNEYKDVLTGGTVALHKLAYKLAERGHNVFVFCKPEYPHPNIKVMPAAVVNRQGFMEEVVWDAFTYPLDKTVAVYPQITRHNPFNTAHVARWILYSTEADIESGYGETDVYFNYGDFKTNRDQPVRPLTVFEYYLDKLKISNTGKRKGLCHIIHKHTPPGGAELLEKLGSFDLGNWKTLGAWDYLAEKLNEYEYFLTYDQKSFYTIAAGLCGCKSIILNPGPTYEFSSNAESELPVEARSLTPTQYRLANPIQAFGVAYGWDDIHWANKTIGLVRDHITELEKIDNTTVDQFIEFWRKKIESC